MLYERYYHALRAVQEQIIRTQAQAICAAAEEVAACVRRNGILYVFGCGHSHIVAEELFYRAGGLVPVSAMLDGGLMLHEGAVKSSFLERTEGLARHLFRAYAVTENDLLLVVSTSGINAAPLEMTQEAQRSGVRVLAITSRAYAGQPVRHACGRHLSRLADLCVDNCVPLGDAVARLPQSGRHTGAVSTAASVLAAQCIAVQAAEDLELAHWEAPIFQSGNVADGMCANQRYIEQYRGRIKNL